MGAYVAVALPVLIEGGSLNTRLITEIHSGPIGFTNLANAPKCCAVSTMVAVACSVIARRLGPRKERSKRVSLRPRPRPELGKRVREVRGREKTAAVIKEVA